MQFICSYSDRHRRKQLDADTEQQSLDRKEPRVDRFISNKTMIVNQVFINVYLHKKGLFKQGNVMSSNAWLFVYSMMNFKSSSAAHLLPLYTFIVWAVSIPEGRDIRTEINNTQ